MKPLGKVRERTSPSLRTRGRRFELDMGQPRKSEDLRPRKITSFRGVPFKTQAAAEAALKVIETAWLQGMHLPEAIAQVVPKSVPSRNLGRLLETWFKEVESKEKAGDLSPGYIKTIESYLKHGGNIWAFWRQRSIRDITRLSLEEFDSFLRDRGVHPKTRRNTLGVFRTFMTWCHRRDYILRIPPMPVVPVDEHVPKIINFKTQQAILDTIDEEHRGIFLAMARMGLRPGEARALQVQDYENPTGEDGWLIVRRAFKGPNTWDPVRGTKTRRARRLPVPEDLQIWIAWYVKDAPADAFLFRNTNGKPYPHRVLYRTWRAACKVVGVEVTLYQGCKHSFATHVINRGNVSLEVVQKFLGHADIASTKKYAKLQDESLRAVLR